MASSQYCPVLHREQEKPFTEMVDFFNILNEIVMKLVIMIMWYVYSF